MGIKIEIDRRLGNFPQFRGSIIAAGLGEEEEIAEAGINVARMISSEPTTRDKDEGRVINKQKAKPTPQQRAEEAAKRMLEAGHTLQKIGEVVARILERK